MQLLRSLLLEENSLHQQHLDAGAESSFRSKTPRELNAVTDPLERRRGDSHHAARQKVVAPAIRCPILHHLYCQFASGRGLPDSCHSCCVLHHLSRAGLDWVSSKTDGKVSVVGHWHGIALYCGSQEELLEGVLGCEGLPESLLL